MNAQDQSIKKTVERLPVKAILPNSVENEVKKTNEEFTIDCGEI